MIHLVLSFIAIIILLLILGISVAIGRYYGKHQIKKHDDHKIEVVNVAEGAVFGLLGLLIAFSFSGAYDRYEHRKIHVLEEANAYQTAYDLIDLTPAKLQPSLREGIRQHLNLHLAVYTDIPNMKQVDDDLHKTQLLQHQIWQQAIQATQESPNKDLDEILLPAIYKLFESSNTGINLARIHPPGIIFALLIGLAALGGFLVGYTAAENKEKHPVHNICYILLTAFTIYVIVNVEFPRVGFLRYSSFDQVLVDVKNNMT